jgi:hypothetical protein
MCIMWAEGDDNGPDVQLLRGACGASMILPFGGALASLRSGPVFQVDLSARTEDRTAQTLLSRR